MAIKRSKVLKIANECRTKYGNDPVGWIREYINFDGLKYNDLTPQQEEIARSLVKHKNICVSSGTGIGKSAIVAMLIQWFLITHPMSKVPTTAPTSKQLHDILWSEIGIWLGRNRLRSMYRLVTGKGKLSIVGFPEWFAVARTVARDKRELNDTLAGFHGQGGVLICVDEASGVPDPVFTALAGAMTDEKSYIILISNPVSTGGFYYDTITDPEGRGKDFKVMFFSSKDSPLVDKSYEEFVINRWGEDSPMYRAKILGQPISEYDSVVVAPEVFDEVVNTQKQMDVGSYILSVDVGGGGPDSTIFCYRCGRSVYRWDEFQKTDPTWIADRITQIWQSQFQGKPFLCIVDAHGIGAGVYSNLTKTNMFPVIGFIGPQQSAHPTMFKDKRTEGFYQLHKTFTDLHFPVPPPKRLKKELANLKFEYGDGPISMEPKKTFKSRLGFSPDYSDALMMSVMAEVLGEPMKAKYVPPATSNILKKLSLKTKADRYGKFSKFVT